MHAVVLRTYVVRRSYHAPIIVEEMQKAVVFLNSRSRTLGSAALARRMRPSVLLLLGISTPIGPSSSTILYILLAAVYRPAVLSVHARSCRILHHQTTSSSSYAQDVVTQEKTLLSGTHEVALSERVVEKFPSSSFGDGTRCPPPCLPFFQRRHVVAIRRVGVRRTP